MMAYSYIGFHTRWSNCGGRLDILKIPMKPGYRVVPWHWQLSTRITWDLLLNAVIFSHKPTFSLRTIIALNSRFRLSTNDLPSPSTPSYYLQHRTVSPRQCELVIVWSIMHRSWLAIQVNISREYRKQESGSGQLSYFKVVVCGGLPVALCLYT